MKLSGLRQAIYVLKCLANDEAQHEIIDKFEGDDQLVLMWLDFLVQNKWAEKPDGKWMITDMGKTWVEKYAH